MEEKLRFILIVLSLLVLTFGFGNLEKIEKEFIEKIEEEAKKLSVENGFSDDTRLIQVVDESSMVTSYQHLPNEKKGSLVYRKKGSDSGKEVIVLDSEDDRLNLKKSWQKRIFVVLKKDPAEKNQFFVFYAYIRNLLVEESEGAVEISGEKYKIEWETWDHRGSRNLAVLFGWTTCSRSLLISCKKEDGNTESNSKSIKLSEPEPATPDYSEEEIEEEEDEEDSDLQSGRGIKKIAKPSPLRNFYPSMDYDELQTAFYLKVIRLATLSEGILFALRPSLEKLLKKYAIDDKLLEQIGTTPVSEQDSTVSAGKKLKRPRSVLSTYLGKALDVFTSKIPEIGALMSQGNFSVTPEKTSDMYIKGAEVMEELLTISTLKGDKLFRVNPNPVILLHNEITLSLSGKAGGAIPILAEVYGVSSDSEEPPLDKLIDIKATNTLIDKILPKFTNESKAGGSRKKAKKDKVQSILDALSPNSFSVLRFKRDDAPDADLHSVHTRNDVFSNLGWTTQQDFGAFAKEASYILNSGTFTGWGPCKIMNENTLSEITSANNVEKLVEIMTELMKTQCDSRVRERVADLINENWIVMTDDKTIEFGTKGLEIVKKAKLSGVESEKLSISFELSVFSKTILNDLKKFANVATSPAHLHKNISKDAFVLLHFSLNALDKARSQCQMHYLMLTRNTLLTLQTALARIMTDIIKISYQSVLTQGKLVKNLKIKSFNNFYNLIGVIHFYTRGSQNIPEHGDVVEEFAKFMESNYKWILKSTKHFTTKIRAAVVANSDPDPDEDE